MKKFAAILTLLAVTSMTASAFAACGNNTSRNSDTSGRSSSSSSTNTNTGNGGSNGGGQPR